MESSGNNEGSEKTEYHVEISPGLTEYYVPFCDLNDKPFEGKKFKSLDDGIKFYRNYASKCSFDVRLGSEKKYRDNTIMLKTVYCNREGEKLVAPFNSESVMCENQNISGSPPKKKIRQTSKRCGCMARVKFKFCPGEGYVVNEFIERHHHMLVSEPYKPFLKENRSLDPAHKQFMLSCVRANIGATRSYRLFKEVVGGYSNIGCTKVEFKNFARDLKAYVAGVDAQMLLEKLFRKKEMNSAFVFDYAVDEHDKLTRLFWADPTCRRNCAAFGDVVSFDATYSINRYNMIFAPFTGKDNHGKCVSLAIGLLSSEDVGAYAWLFEKFIACMGRSPSIITTDQDPAMKIAIEKVLVGTRQRLCMWHIMKKVPEKVPANLKNDQSFKDKLNCIVWSDILEPPEFEVQWKQVMFEFGLMDNNWFKSLFDIREMWIPAYFRDVPMSRIFRTTSMSESENGFFGRYTNPRANLLEFYLNIESALDSQRHTLDAINSQEEIKVPFLETPLAIEKHASFIYTALIFREVQNEIVAACFGCRVASLNENGDMFLYDIEDCSGLFKVAYDKRVESVVCSCKKFVREGLLCSHIFFIFKELRIEKVPDKYIVSRWTKSAFKNTVYDMQGVAGGQSSFTDENKALTNQIMSEFYTCVGLAEGNVDTMSALLRGIRELNTSLTVDGDQASTSSAKRKLFDNFYGTSIPDDVTVLPPSTVNNKGSRSRLKSFKETAIQNSNKPLRMCSRCKQKSNHDARNCPVDLN